MPTEKPRISFALPEDLRDKIETYRFDNHVRNLTQAVIQLLDKGLSVLEEESKNEKPATGGGQSDDELEFIGIFDRLSPSNQRLLLDIGALILQGQEKPLD